jgi:hypothetical protein
MCIRRRGKSDYWQFFMKHDDLDDGNDAFKIWVTPNSFFSNSQQVRNRWNLAVISTLDVNCTEIWADLHANRCNMYRIKPL